MEHQNIKHFDISKKRPQVLLVGNGLVYQKNFSWDNFINKISQCDKHIILGDKVPYSIKATAISDVSDTTRHDKYHEVFSKYNYSSFNNLKQLLEIPFDAVLTTNYTYEIENHLYKN